MKTFISLVFASVLMVSQSAQAHFLLAYTPEVNFQKPATVPFKLIFWHPFENGHVMDLEEPNEFYAVYRGKKTDLKDSLKEITFTGVSNQAKAYEGALKVKRNGDYIVVVEQQPYFEASEDLYIQHIVKSYINKGGMPSGWEEPLGLKTEIVPLNKPTNIVAGSSFTGRLLSEGKPVAGAEIEIEYISAEPDMEKNQPKEQTAEPGPGGSLVAISDEQGYFTFAIPKAGFWGFAALGSGPDKTFEGKELEQDAVIWIRAYDM